MLMLQLNYKNNEVDHTFTTELNNFNITYAADAENSRCFLRCADNSDLNELITALKEQVVLENLTILNGENQIIYQNTDWRSISDIAINGDNSHIIKTIILSL